MSAAICGIDLPILLYHEIVESEHPNPAWFEVSVRQFQRQLDELQRWGFNTLSLAQLVRVLDGKEKSPRRPVVITFDDAYRSFVKLALPELVRRRMTAAVFVSAGEIGGTNRWDRERAFPNRSVMTVDELQTSARAGIEIGAHGWLHRSLAGCSPAEAEEEILRSRDELARCLGVSPLSFSYPYGDYLPMHFEMLKNAGYHAAVSISSHMCSVTANRFAMRRVYIHPGDTTLRFRLKLTRSYLRYKAWRGIPGKSA